jgi:alpha,alpha-trehalase
LNALAIRLQWAGLSFRKTDEYSCFENVSPVFGIGIARVRFARAGARHGRLRDAHADSPWPGNRRPPQGQGLEPILDYISNGVGYAYTRSITDCQTLVDPKVKVTPQSCTCRRAWPSHAAVRKLTSVCNVRIEHLPVADPPTGRGGHQQDPAAGACSIVENKYVVPGGRFNEMYGWDSYFIIRGLLRAGRVELARGMVDNFFFEVEHYGAMLNANRTYYLTRSQPPFLSSMFVDVYDALQKSGHADHRRGWREPTPILKKTMRRGTRDPHLAGDTGLSRYYDFGEGPPPEALHRTRPVIYRKVATYFFFHPAQADNYILENRPGSGAAGRGRLPIRSRCVTFRCRWGVRSAKSAGNSS